MVMGTGRLISDYRGAMQYEFTIILVSIPGKCRGFFFNHHYITYAQISDFESINQIKIKLINKNKNLGYYISVYVLSLHLVFVSGISFVFEATNG